MNSIGKSEIGVHIPLILIMKVITYIMELLCNLTKFSC